MLLLGLLTLSHWYPQGAFPGWSAVIGFGLLGTFALSAGAALRACRQRGLMLRPAPIVAFAAAAAWMLWWGIRQGGAPVPALARPDVAAVFQGFLVFASAACIVFLWKSEQHPAAPFPGRAVPRWLTVLAGILALHALYQVLGPRGLPGTYATMAADIATDPSVATDPVLEGVLHALREARASGRLGSPNVFAGLMVIAFPLALGVARGRWKWPALATAAVLAWGVVLSGSRGGLLALAAAAMLFGVLALAGLRPRRAAPVAAVAMLFLIVLTGADSGDDALARRWLGMTTVQQRLHYWETGWAIWRESPVLGRGPGAFEVYYPQHRVAGAQETGFAHNWIVQWGSEVGLAGLAFFLAWMGAAAALGVRWWNAARGNPHEREAMLLAAGIVAAAAGALAHGLVEFTLQYREIYLDLCLVVGLAVGCGAAEVPARRAGHAAGVRVLAVPALLILIAGGFGWYQNGFAPAMAERARAQAEWRLEDRDPQAAVEAYTRALRWQPDDPRLFEARAFARAAAGDPRGSDDVHRALALHPNSARLHATLAHWLAGEGRLHEAIAAQRDAVRLHPLDATHRMELAGMLWQAGRPEEAREELEATRDLLLTPLEKARREALATAMEEGIGEPGS